MPFNYQKTGLGIRSFWKWAIALFLAKNERFGISLIFCSFLLFRSLWKSERAIALFTALLKRATKRVIAHLLFSKEWKKSDHSLPLLQRATKRTIAHSLFFKEQSSERLHNRSFEYERWAIEQMSNCPTLLSAGLGIYSFGILKMSDCSFLLFRSFWESKRATKIAIAHSLFSKEWHKEQLLFRSFAKSDKKSDCSFALF